MEKGRASDDGYNLLLGAGAPKKKGLLWTWDCGRIAILALSVLALLALGLAKLVHGEPQPEEPPVATPGSSARLRITNGCIKDSLWLANFAFQAPYFPQDLELAAGETHSFAIPDEGLAATRFWAKWKCDATGKDCKIGESGGPGESCSSTNGCAPPVDSKFEATFGCLVEASKCAHNPSLPSEPLGPTDWWDVSQVDGWTLPYKVEIVGECPGAPAVIDCSSLSLDSCPEDDNLGPSGTQSLRVHDPGDSSLTVGCYSPCAKLTYAQWGQGLGFPPDATEARHYCCPTPPISPEQCSTGPVVDTKFVKAVHKRECMHVCMHAHIHTFMYACMPASVSVRESRTRRSSSPHHASPSPSPVPGPVPVTPLTPHPSPLTLTLAHHPHPSPIALTITIIITITHHLHSHPTTPPYAVCPGVYGYAYDDGMGLAQCPAGTKYEVTFYCPQGA